MFKLFALVIVAVVLAIVNGNIHDRAYYESKFFDWLSTHNIKPIGGEHFVQMLQNFANNDDIIETHNAKGLSYTLGHNKFSGMSLEEWKSFVHLGLSRPESQPDSIHAAPVDASSLATSMDWNASGKVTPVKDQGQCGSCWSFSTTGALEGAYSIKYGSLISFSEQNFVDCDNRKNGGKDMGCNGGLMDNAFAWAKQNGGVCTEAEYPYVSGTTKTAGTCNQASCAVDSKVAPKSFTDVQTNSVTALKSALNKQPVSVAIEADQSAFQLYKSGVFDGKCGTNLDHGVLAVGYGTESSKEFFLVKNSWGESWGDGGYIKLAITGITQPEGQCGILAGPPSYPNL